MMFMEKSTLIVSMVALLAACSKTGNEGEKPYSYKAAITVTEYGIPHITANDYASLGFGEGYMAAKDHICNISFNIIAANGETSKYLGNGPKNRYLRQNSVTRALGIPEKSQIAFKNQSADIQDMYKGYAAGFNKFLKEEENTSWCKGASWVKPVTAIDLFSQVTYIVQTLPRMAGALYTASPPSEEQISTSAEREELLLASEAALHLNGMGSNAWAFGKEMSENGRGMLLANPHYPWFGTNRFWEKHLTIPGKMDVYGVSLIGGPGVVIGFNQDIGWTHTVSASQRVVIYKLDLVEGDPTSYIFDGEVRKMTSRDVNIMVRKEDGTLEQETKTFWSSHHGPIAIFRDLEWTDKNAYAVRDANRDNMYTVAQWFDMSRATSMDNLETALKKWNAMPWVNAIATGKEGKAAYFDNSVVGNLSNEAMDLWQKQYDSDDLTKSLYDQRSMTLLNGSDSR